MTGYIQDTGGTTRRLPALVGWELTYAIGTPCDAFSVSFPCTAEMWEALRGAVRFRAVEQGETVFTGVVDEFEATAEADGMVCVLQGRGMAALLLDNEAEAAEYSRPTLRYILDRHVRPLGITGIRGDETVRADSFSVSTGQSQWSVLAEFLRFTRGTRPWFDREGVLHTENTPGGRRKIDGRAAAIRQSYGETRYGVISRVTVINRVRGTRAEVDNAAFLARGGACRRVVNVPRSTGYDAMRYTGEYQIAESQRDSVVCRLRVAVPFAAFAGDTVELTDSPLGLSGTYTVEQSRCKADGASVWTELTLYPG